MNLTELNILLRDVSLSRKSVHEYQEGDVYQNLNSGEHKYGCINWTVNNVQVLDNTLVVNCYLFYIDRLLEDSSNKLSIWTVGSNTLHQILNAAKNSTDFFSYDNLTFTTFTEKFSDLCAGVYASCDIQILGNVSECDEEYIWRESAWDAGYTSGYTDGKAAGEVVAYNSGYTNGYASGKTDGYESGLTIGYESGYTKGFADGVDSCYDYLALKAITTGCAVAMNVINPQTGASWDINYSFDKVHWTKWDYNEVTVANGKTIYFRGVNSNGTCYRQNTSCYLQFVTAGRFAASGDITSLINGKGGDVDMQIPYTHKAFYRLFYGTNITTIPNLTVSKPGQYQYYETFKNCNMLTNVELKFDVACNGMLREAFYGCSGLISATIDIPSTSGSSGDIFLATFRDCTSLSSVTAYIQTLSVRKQTETWLYNTAPTGNFYNLGGFDYSGTPAGWYAGIPENWTEYRIQQV